MAPTRRRSEPKLTVESAPAYEFILTLVNVAEVDNQASLELGTEWIDATRQRAGAALLAQLDDLSRGSGDQFLHLLPIAYEAPAPRSVDDFLGHLAEVDATDIVLRLIGYYEPYFRRMIAPETIRAAVEGDRGAAQKVIAAASEHHSWQDLLTKLLGQDPETTKTALLRMLRDWKVRVWQFQEATLVPILERDADAKRSMIDDLPLERFVELATNGVEYSAHGQIDRLVLVPTYVNRPWVSHVEFAGLMLMTYPVADESTTTDREAPPLKLVRLAKALGDERRLRILRSLAEKPQSLADLAKEFDLPKTTMHHHMVALRSAGLVSVRAMHKDYRLREDALPSLTQLLSGYLATPGVSDAPVAPRPVRRVASPGRPRSTKTTTRR